MSLLSALSPSWSAVQAGYQRRSSHRGDALESCNACASFPPLANWHRALVRTRRQRTSTLATHFPDALDHPYSDVLIVPLVLRIMRAETTRLSITMSKTNKSR